MPRAPEPLRPGTLALSANDFAPRRTASDLARRMNAWGRGVAAKLRTAGLELTLGEAREDPDGHGHGPLGVVFSGRARAVLELQVDGAAVRAGLVLPAVQARAVRADLASPERALELSTAFEALPEQFAVRVEGDAAAVDAPRCTIDDLRALLDRADGSGRALGVGWTVPRDVAVEHAALLDEQLKDALVALVRVFTLLGGPDDSAGSRSSHEGAHAHRHSAHSHSARSARSDDDRDRASAKKRSHDAAQRDGREAPREHHGQRDSDGDGERDGAAAASHRRHGTSKDGASSRPPDLRAPPRGSARRRPGLKTSAAGKSRGGAIERGARVRVLEGPFSGKVGVVHELDGKGGARVMLGLLAVRFDVSNLAVHDEGRRRPVLGTSHRKPVPVRS